MSAKQKEIVAGVIIFIVIAGALTGMYRAAIEEDNIRDARNKAQISAAQYQGGE